MTSDVRIDGRTRRRLATRERLYEAAAALIVERGFEATTMDDIATRARTSRRTAHNHFPTKGEIALEFTRRRRVRAMEAARRAPVRASGPPAVDRLRAYIHELGSITEEEPVVTREMLVGWLRIGGPVRTALPDELRSLLLSDEGAGQTCSTEQATLAAEILFDVYQGALARWVRNETSPPEDFSKELDAAVDLVIRGIQRSLAGD